MKHNGPGYLSGGVGRLIRRAPFCGAKAGSPQVDLGTCESAGDCAAKYKPFRLVCLSKCKVFQEIYYQSCA
tara:strand:+ start:362 stop:574 length:213 start_codon:yes stop_codon:yes gene_type:complete